MKYLTNTYDPKRKDAKIYVARLFSETPEEAWQNHLNYLKDKVIGEPQATEWMTVELLKANGYVGVYSND